MKKTVVAFGVVVLATLLVGGGVIGYGWLRGGSGEASGPLTAPTIAIPTAPTKAEATPTERAQGAVAAESVAVTQAPAAKSPTVEATPAPLETAVDARSTSTPAAVASKAPPARIRYQIDPERSEVRFEIDEILRGQPNRVVGTTNQIAGEGLVDLGTPAASQLGAFRVNVRTLRTDDARRDRAIRSFVLESGRDDYEFATFVPRMLEGMPESITAGAPFSFWIVGDLTIRDISAEVVFSATVTVNTSEEVEGSAEATIKRDTFKLEIPSVPSVASVGEEVLVGIKFVASAAGEG